MNDTERRLADCFNLVFPDIEGKHLRRASKTSVAGWDSVATVTLINVVEEEFGIQISFDDVDQFSSFELFLRYLDNREIETKP